MSENIQSLPHVTGQCVESLPADQVFKVLLINPNSTERMTADTLKMVEQSMPPDIIVYGYTAPPKAPTTIGCYVDGVISAAEIIRDAHAIIPQADAVLVACFSDHPLINCVREEFEMPACGIMEAAIYTSRLLGARFGIITTMYRSQIKHADAVRSYGLDGYCAGLLSSGLEAAELHSKPRQEVLDIMGRVAVRLVEEKDADALILGCAGMTDMQEAVEKAVKKYDVPVIDGVVTGVNMLAGIVRSGLKTSKRGLFSSSASARKARGQDWL